MNLVPTFADGANAATVAWPSGMRLGIITGSTAFRDPAGNVWINHSTGRLYEAIRERVPGTRICLPLVPRRETSHNHLLHFPAEAIVALPPLTSTLSSQFHYFSTRKIVKRFAAGVDLLFYRLPFQLPLVLHGLPQPKLLHIIGNTREIIDASTSYSPLVKKLAQGFASHTERSMRRLAADPRNRTVTNGAEMWHRLGCRRGRVVVSSCLRRDEMQPRSDTTLRDPPRLLFVGYIRPEKGCLLLLEAFERLRRTRPLKLTLAGGSSRPSALEQSILDRVRASPFHADITLAGIVEFGEPLFNLYRDHDIYLLPTFSEGTPRTLVEARAFGCPVIASNVGGIPSSVDDGRDGLLVPPNDVDALEAAVNRLLDDEALRNRLIQSGLERSRDRSLESFADELVEELRLLADELAPSQPHISTSPA